MNFLVAALLTAVLFLSLVVVCWCSTVYAQVTLIREGRMDIDDREVIGAARWWCLRGNGCSHKAGKGHSSEWDAYYCLSCLAWLEHECGDASCSFRCGERPANAEDAGSGA